METIENPYASPTFGKSRNDADTLLNSTTMLYRGMGWTGVVYIAFLCAILLIRHFEMRQAGIEVIVGTAIGFAPWIVFFVYLIKTGAALERDFDGTYRRARWLGILVAAMFFPLGTIPGVLAVQRLERYRKHTSERA